MNDTPIQPGSAGIVDRAKAILMSPVTEWAKIATETEQPMQVFLRYAVPLAAIGPIATLIGGQVFGYGILGVSYNPSLMTGITTAITSFVLTLISLWLVSWVANFISPKFGGQSNFPAAFRLVAYSMTASWVVGIFGLVPSLSILGILGLYSFYLFYKGAQPVMNVPAEKSTSYTIVTVLVAIVAYIIVGAIGAAISGVGSMASGDMASSSSGGDDVTIDLGQYGKIEAGEDGAVAVFTNEDGEEMTITVDNNEE